MWNVVIAFGSPSSEVNAEGRSFPDTSVGFDEALRFFLSGIRRGATHGAFGYGPVFVDLPLKAEWLRVPLKLMALGILYAIRARLEEISEARATR
jgi:hypothetical protein